MKYQATNLVEYKEQLLNRVALLRINGSVQDNVEAVNEVLNILESLHRASRLAQWKTMKCAAKAIGSSSSLSGARDQ